MLRSHRPTHTSLLLMPIALALRPRSICRVVTPLLCAALMLFVALATSLASADEIVLRDGSRLDGCVQMLSDGRIAITLGGATAFFEATEVVSIERGPTVQERFEHRLLQLDRSDYEAILALASWAQQRELLGQATALRNDASVLDLKQRLHKYHNGPATQLIETARWSVDHGLDARALQQIQERLLALAPDTWTAAGWLAEVSACTNERRRRQGLAKAAEQRAEQHEQQRLARAEHRRQLAAARLAQQRASRPQPLMLGYAGLSYRDRYAYSTSSWGCSSTTLSRPRTIIYTGSGCSTYVRTTSYGPTSGSSWTRTWR